jgi:hypothetical protein
LALLPVDPIDVGAVGGLGAPWRDHLAAVGHVLGFEPNQPARRDGRRWTSVSAIWHWHGRRGPARRKRAMRRLPEALLAGR